MTSPTQKSKLSSSAFSMGPAYSLERAKKIVSESAEDLQRQQSPRSQICKEAISLVAERTLRLLDEEFQEGVSGKELEMYALTAMLSLAQSIADPDQCEVVKACVTAENFGREVEELSEKK